MLCTGTGTIDLVLVHVESRNLDLLMLDIHVLRRGGSGIDGTALCGSTRMVVHVFHAVVIFHFNRCRI